MTKLDSAAMTIDLTTSVGGIPLECCIYNASGPRSGTAAALHKVAMSAATGAVLTKSATLMAQTGNPQPRTWHSPDDAASLNSEGLPNNGIDYYISESTINETLQRDDGTLISKPYIVSLSGKTLHDNLEMLKRIAESPTLPKIASVELNLACPNVIGKPIIAYDIPQMDDILKAATQQISSFKVAFPPLGIKLPPYLDFAHFQTAANVLNQHKSMVKYVVCINTIGNALAMDAVADMPVISSNQGFAGLSGPAVRYTALANVCKLRSLLDSSIDIVGVGGIRTGQDVYEMLLVGATACQIATTHWKEGPDCFDRIQLELIERMQSKNVTSVHEIKGQGKIWSKEGAAKSREYAKQEKERKCMVATPSKQQSGSFSSATCDTELRFYKRITMVLTVVLAVVLVHQWRSGISLLPSE